MNRNFGDAERHIQALFNEGSVVTYNNEQYVILKSGKPTCSSGEPKTDVYVLFRKINDNKHYDLKISIKKSNADFLENKISSERAEAILGPDWQSIITNSTLNIRDSFENRSLIFKEKSGRTNKGSITLGWKFELVNKISGELSGNIILSHDQILDIYSGTNLSDDKKHASVNGEIIENSGVAYFILEGELDHFSTAEEVMSSVVPISEYIQQNGNIYFACKALNYRTFESKFDGNRPLSVFVDWNVVNNKLTPTLVFNNPLNTKGNAVANKLLNSLSQLNISDTDDININNVSSLDYVY